MRDESSNTQRLDFLKTAGAVSLTASLAGCEDVTESVFEAAGVDDIKSTGSEYGLSKNAMVNTGYPGAESHSKTF